MALWYLYGGYVFPENLSLSHIGKFDVAMVWIDIKRNWCIGAWDVFLYTVFV